MKAIDMLFEMEMANFKKRQWLPLIHSLSKEEIETYYKQFLNNSSKP